MKNDRCAINFEIFLLDILSCKEALTLYATNCLSVFYDFVKLALKALSTVRHSTKLKRVF